MAIHDCMGMQGLISRCSSQCVIRCSSNIFRSNNAHGMLHEHTETLIIWKYVFLVMIFHASGDPKQNPLMKKLLIFIERDFLTIDAWLLPINPHVHCNLHYIIIEPAVASKNQRELQSSSPGKLLKHAEHHFE